MRTERESHQQYSNEEDKKEAIYKGETFKMITGEQASCDLDMQKM